MLKCAASMCLWFGAVSAWAQMPTNTDQLLFKDGDRMSGEVIRAEHGVILFRTNKTGDMNVSFDQLQELRCDHLFAIIRENVRVTRGNAVMGRMELRGDDLIIKPEGGGAEIVMKSYDVAFAIDEATFLREIARKTQLHEGWSAIGSLGGALVRSTENGLAFNGDLTITRALPGVDYLPPRNRTEITLRDTYEHLTTPVPGGPAVDAETHIFHAGVERLEYLQHQKFYALGHYTFDRNYAQGLLAQHLYGAGMGWTVTRTFAQQLDLRADVHVATQQFNTPDINDTLMGQKFTVEYQRALPARLSLMEIMDYVPAYNDPHRYSAASSTVLSVPMFWHLGISFSVIDNYLNNPVSGFKRNTFRATTNVTFSYP